MRKGHTSPFKGMQASKQASKKHIMLDSTIKHKPNTAIIKQTKQESSQLEMLRGEKTQLEMSQGEVNSCTEVAWTEIHFKPQESLPLEQWQGPPSDWTQYTFIQDPNQLPNTR